MPTGLNRPLPDISVLTVGRGRLCYSKNSRKYSINSDHSALIKRSNASGTNLKSNAWSEVFTYSRSRRRKCFPYGSVVATSLRHDQCQSVWSPWSERDWPHSFWADLAIKTESVTNFALINDVAGQTVQLNK